MKLTKLLDILEKFYGKPKPPQPTDPYEMVLHRIAGYPQSDANCDKGFAALKKEVGLSPEKIFNASDAKLRAAMREGGIVPELRALRLKEIAARVLQEYKGDRKFLQKKSPAEAKKILKQLPTIGDSGAEKILLYSGMSPVAAVPVNAVHVLTRLGFGHEYKNWGASYKSAQEALSVEVPERTESRLRAYLLLKQHGQILCKSARPKCEECPVSAECLYYKKMRM
jgi:endonuclease-3